jgi:hypothetical protein
LAVIDLGESSLTVPTSGSTILPIEKDRRHDLELRLVVWNETRQTTQRALKIRLRCPYTYFFEPAPTGWAWCPYRPAGFSWAAEQRFENGRMLWLQEIPGESTPEGVAEGPLIFVLYDGGPFPQWAKYEDTWRDGQPESDPAILPPQGLYQPIRGFGKLWREVVGVRDRLGWALAPEQGFEGAYQIDWEPAYSSDGAYLRTADGRVIILTVLGIWQFVNL